MFYSANILNVMQYFLKREWAAYKTTSYFDLQKLSWANQWSTIVFEGKLENIFAKFGDPIAFGNVELKQIRSKDKLLRQVHHENQLYQLFQMCYVSSPELRELHELGA